MRACRSRAVIGCGGGAGVDGATGITDSVVEGGNEVVTVGEVIMVDTGACLASNSTVVDSVAGSALSFSSPRCICMRCVLSELLSLAVLGGTSPRYGQPGRPAPVLGFASLP